MRMGMIGLGKMGSNMVRRLARGEHECVVYDRSQAQAESLAKEGALPAKSVDELIEKLSSPRVVWMMVPAGIPTEQVFQEVLPKLEKGDVLIDGGNSYFKDDVRRARIAAERGVDYVDVGTSGGVWGLERGYCLMIGSTDEAFQKIEPILRALSPGGSVPQKVGEKAVPTEHEGYLHCGRTGSGHFVKMVHNGIEYGMMQSIAEGFDIMRNADSSELPEEMRFDLELGRIAEVWRRGSVVSSWLLDLVALSMGEDPALESYTGFVEDSGEGRWTIQAAIEEAVSADVLSAALFARFRSRKEHSFAEKMLSAMRRQFGGHLENVKRPIRRSAS